MKAVLAGLKPLLRWFVLGAVLFFLLQVLRNHWQGVAGIRIAAAGWASLAIALGLTLLAHIWAGWVWSRILQRDFRQPVPAGKLIQSYLQTNLAKYLPGNIWHYYGRVSAATQAGATLESATVSVLLEPLLMAAAALIVALLSGQAVRVGAIATNAVFAWEWVVLQWLILLATLVAIHPWVLNPVLQKLATVKQKALPSAAAAVSVQVDDYPWAALLGNVGFLLLRGAGFLFFFLAIYPINAAQIPSLLGGFSLAWLMGLIVPGAPGGLGIFEATAIALLGHLHSPAILLSVVACYRVVSVVAEAIGAGLAWLDH